MSKGCNECNKWKQKHDHIFAEVRRQAERIAALEAVAKAQKEYIELIATENRELISFAAPHGWGSSRISEGRAARVKIDNAMQAAGYGEAGK